MISWEEHAHDNPILGIHSWPAREFAHRSIVWGTRGMVGGGTQLTAQAGMRILWQEGNAVDAAVAAAFAAVACRSRQRTTPWAVRWPSCLRPQQPAGA